MDPEDILKETMDDLYKEVLSVLGWIWTIDLLIFSQSHLPLSYQDILHEFLGIESMNYWSSDFWMPTINMVCTPGTS